MSGTESWQRAASFAARAHHGQVRKDGVTPYVAHAFRVAMTVRDVFECDDEACLAAALLHDTIEDTPTDYDDILEGWGREVANCVAALTKDMRLEEHVREEAYDRRLREAGWRAALVKLADVYDNLSDVVTRKDAPNVEKLIDRCRRARTIAEPHASSVPGVARALVNVETLVAAHMSGGTA